MQFVDSQGWLIWKTHSGIMSDLYKTLYHCHSLMTVWDDNGTGWKMGRKLLRTETSLGVAVILVWSVCLELFLGSASSSSSDDQVTRVLQQSLDEAGWSLQDESMLKQDWEALLAWMNTWWCHCFIPMKMYFVRCALQIKQTVVSYRMTVQECIQWFHVWTLYALWWRPEPKKCIWWKTGMKIARYRYQQGCSWFTWLICVLGPFLILSQLDDAWPS